MKTEVIRILEKRVEDFEKIHHSYEAREVRSAIDTIKRLIPPELFAIHGVSNCATSMEEILNEAQRRKAKHSVQYSDYSLDTWTVANDLLEHRKNALLADGSVRKVRIEYEM